MKAELKKCEQPRDAGSRCLVGHYKDDKLQPPCARCEGCHEWIPADQYEAHFGHKEGT